MTRCAVLLAALVASPGAAQIVSPLMPAGAGGVSAAAMNAAIAAAVASKADSAAIPSTAGLATTAQVTAAVTGLASQSYVDGKVAALPTASAVASQISAATSGLATSSALTAVQSLIPIPAAAVPPTEMVGGTVGTAGTYRPADSAQPRITRAGTVTTDTGGGWSVTWTTALSATPVVIPIPVNATTQPVVCNVTTRTATAASGRCWYSRTLPATLTLLSALVSYDIFGASAAGISVQVVALPPTQ